MCSLPVYTLIQCDLLTFLPTLFCTPSTLSFPQGMFKPVCFVLWSIDFNQYHLCGRRFGTPVRVHWVATQARQWLVPLSESTSCQQFSRKNSGCLRPSSIHDWQLTGPVLCRLRIGRQPLQLWDHVCNAMSCPEDSISQCFFLCPACTFYFLCSPSFTMFPEP